MLAVAQVRSQNSLTYLLQLLSKSQNSSKALLTRLLARSMAMQLYKQTEGFYTVVAKSKIATLQIAIFYQSLEYGREMTQCWRKDICLLWSEGCQRFGLQEAKT